MLFWWAGVDILRDFVEGAPASPIDPLNIGSLANVGFVGSMVFLGRIFKAIYEGAPAGPFCSFARQYRGLTRFGTSADDRAFGLVNWNLGGGIENVPMWRGSEGDPLCAVTRVSIGHLVEGAPARL